MRPFPILAITFLLGLSLQAQDPFLAKPFLQMGAEPKADRMDLVWLAPDKDAGWVVEVQTKAFGPWKLWAAQPSKLRLCLNCQSTGSTPRPSTDSSLVWLSAIAYPWMARRFSSPEGHGPKECAQPQRIILYGDAAIGSDHQRPSPSDGRTKTRCNYCVGRHRVCRGRASNTWTITSPSTTRMRLIPLKARRCCKRAYGGDPRKP